ncbi:MFS transporter [Sphingomonas sp. GB1N7]|uniref:MFS transporter n=1 Tax=Parasphingomonas caseinilytica TaxID=3096158 RepID=UPI002FCC4A37
MVLFASGDFACNLYWQSVTLFLFFYYTDVLHLPPAMAGAIATAGALWDGVANILVGAIAQRSGAYRRFLLVGSVPLGLAFVLVYALPAQIWMLVFAQMLFRTAYAVVNVPYAALSARISLDSRDRTLIAGLRMLFGTLAAVAVTMGTPWIALRLTGDALSPQGFLIAATVFAVIATPLLAIVATSMRDTQAPQPDATDPSIATCIAALVRNRAFVTLNLASAAIVVAIIFVGQSVLYYFKHVAHAGELGPNVLAMMSVAGAVAVPLWMMVTARIGVRAAWIGATGIGWIALAGFAVSGGTGEAQLLFVVIQAVFVAFNLGLWAMLPDTVEYGELQSGVRVEAMAFGVSALIQRIALGFAIWSMGMSYEWIGYRAYGVLAPHTVAAITALLIYVPAIALGVGLIAMFANPLRRGAHARLVAELERRRASAGPIPPSG